MKNPAKRAFPPRFPGNNLRSAGIHNCNREKSRFRCWIADFKVPRSKTLTWHYNVAQLDSHNLQLLKQLSHFHSPCLCVPRRGSCACSDPPFCHFVWHGLVPSGRGSGVATRFIDPCGKARRAPR